MTDAYQEITEALSPLRDGEVMASVLGSHPRRSEITDLQAFGLELAWMACWENQRIGEWYEVKKEAGEVPAEGPYMMMLLAMEMVKQANELGLDINVAEQFGVCS